MKSIYKYLLSGFLATIMLASCEKELERTVYPHSTPVIESAAINPTAFVYGDSIAVTAKVSDPKTPLSTLEVKLVVNDVLVAKSSIRAKGNSAEINEKIPTAFLSELPENANVEVLLTLINAEGDKTSGTITNIKGKRTYYNRLYLILRDGSIYPLTPESLKSDKYTTGTIDMKSNAIEYRIAEKITNDNQIDFSGRVWGMRNDAIQLIDESGGYIKTGNSDIDITTSIVFDALMFNTTLVGKAILLTLEDFEDFSYDGKNYKKLMKSYAANQVIRLAADLTDNEIIFNADYFVRQSSSTVKFIGEGGEYELYYSADRKAMIVHPAEYAFPKALLICGKGIGILSKVKPEATIDWGFEKPIKAISFRRMDTNIYQGTIYITPQANFKPFENDGWGNEKKSTDFTFSGGVLCKDTDKGVSDGNWYALDTATAGNYKVTINLATKTVNVEPYTLP